MLYRLFSIILPFSFFSFPSKLPLFLSISIHFFIFQFFLSLPLKILCRSFSSIFPDLFLSLHKLLISDQYLNQLSYFPVLFSFLSLSPLKMLHRPFTSIFPLPSFQNCLIILPISTSFFLFSYFPQYINIIFRNFLLFPFSSLSFPQSYSQFPSFSFLSFP